MDENPYQAPEFVGSPTTKPDRASWPLWVRINLMGISSRTFGLVSVGGSMVLAVICGWLAWFIPTVWLLAVFLGAILVVNAFIDYRAIRWVDRHEAWPNRDGDGMTSTAREKRGKDSRA